MQYRFRSLFIVAALLMIAASCGSSASTEADGDAVATTVAAEEVSGSTDADESADEVDDESSEDESSGAVGEGLNLALFADGAVAGDAATEDCTLSDGASAMCYRITVSGYPSTYEVGPFCPATTSDTAEDGGIWFDGDAVYDLDGEFILNLATLYNDDNWQLYNDDGSVNVTDTEEAFEGAARPDVEEQYQNHCVEGQLEWLDNGEPIQSTVLIPTVPVAASQSSSPRGNYGVTLDGIVIAESAPVAAIMGAYTIAAFDDCGGHFNPFEGYHLHGARGCGENGDAADGETAIFGYAMDGYAVHSPLSDEQLAATELDSCGGHETDADGYHYHANSAEQNQVISCLVGQTA